MIQSNQSFGFAALKEGLKGCGQRVSYQLFSKSSDENS